MDEDLKQLKRTAYALGELDRAETLSVRALALQEASLGTEHPEVALTVFNAAELSLRRNDLATAETRYRRSLEIRESSGSNPLALATNRLRLGDLLVKRERYVEAESLIEQSLATITRIQGPEHSGIIRAGAEFVEAMATATVPKLVLKPKETCPEGSEPGL